VNVLFDQGTPAPLRRALVGHSVEKAYERNRSTLQSGELIAAAVTAQFEVLVTTDQNLKYRQNLATRTLAIVVLLATSWPRIQNALLAILAAVDGAVPGGCIEAPIE
jgi:hypothetical protein